MLLFLVDDIHCRENVYSNLLTRELRCKQIFYKMQCECAGKEMK